MNKSHFKSISKDYGKLSQFICHQKPERTFKIKGHYLPVCSRCTGFYLGAFSYFIFVYFFYILYTSNLVILGFLMLIPFLFDGFTQLYGIRESDNQLRLFTGVIGGIGFAILVKAFKAFIMANGVF